MASNPEAFDFVIIGGGTAGLVLATRISEHPDLGRVLVIEAGDDQTQDLRVNFPTMWPSLIPTASNWAFETVSQVSCLVSRILPSLYNLGAPLQIPQLREPAHIRLGGSRG